jgi:hypothetical protein
MKTRLENQIEKMQNELDSFITFSNEKTQEFLFDFNTKIVPILSKYKISVIEPMQNTFVDKRIICEPSLIFRVYLKVDLSKLSQIKKENIEKMLREQNVPMPICPISRDSIELVYHN